VAATKAAAVIVVAVVVAIGVNPHSSAYQLSPVDHY